ncbi:MAG TPA: glutamate formimidoyltransferase [Anaerolineae bacterium]|nr:glutamate formimidoyltransferase [Anaerolineae bacterium]HQJ51062.1 glutamate formimidoyltransferase [Anaerolineae bacterium]
MASLLECALNFSEGRRQDVIQAIVGAVQGARLLDVSSDADHNRTVVSFVGSPQEAAAAALTVSARAIELIDMNVHRGAHPRMGAVDVIPFVPLGEATMEQAVATARQVGQELGARLQLPVYLYEAAASRAERRNLADVRHGEYEGLAEKMADPAWKPDYGPAHPHPTAGAVAVGARIFLVAYNVNLSTPDVGIAKTIARTLRAKTGGLQNVKALGVMLQERNIAQVTMNVVDPFQTPLYRVLELVRMEAARYGVSVVGSEVIGLLPLTVLLESARYYLQLEGFRDDQVLEARLWEKVK